MRCFDCQGCEIWVSNWSEQFGNGTAGCEACSKIPAYTSASEGWNGGYFSHSDLPAAMAGFHKLIGFEEGVVLGCPACGQLYLNQFSSSNDPGFGHSEGEQLRKYDFEILKQLVLGSVKKNEDYTIFN